MMTGGEGSVFYQTSEKMVVIANTGPLISALQCGRIELLRRYFAIIYIPQSELAEFESHNVKDEIKALLDEGLLVAQDLTPDEQEIAKDIARQIAGHPLAKVRDYQHHIPEAEAMVLAAREELGCDAILLDELVAREVAQALGLPVAGFVAVLIKARLDGVLTIEEVQKALKTCQRKGTRYSDAFIDEIYRRYGGG
jgi:predicted nucleic acid-binding protein